MWLPETHGQLASADSGRRVALSHLPTILAWTSLVFLAVYFAFFLYRSFYLIAYRYPTLFVEPYLLEGARLLGRGQNIYTDIQEPPYLGVVYPPFFFVVVGLMFRLFGVSYAVGRSISFVSAILIGLVIYKATLQETKQRFVASVAALLFFAAHYVYTFVPDFRVDMLGILLAFSGVFVLSRARENGWLPIVVSPILFSLAFYTKQSLLVAPLAASLYLVVIGKIQKGVAVGALFAAIVVPLFLILNQLTHGQFYQHIVVFHALPLDLERALREMYKWVIMYPVICGLVLVGTLWLTTNRTHLSIWHGYLVASLLVALISTARVGVWINNLIELWAISCTVAGITLASILNNDHERVGRDLALALLVVQCLVIFHAPFLPQSIQKNYFFYQFVRPDHLVSDVAELQARTEIVDLISTNRLETLSFIDGLGNFLDTTDSETIELSPEPFIYDQLHRMGCWNPDSFVQRIRNKEFDLIVSRTSLADYPYEIEEHYSMRRQLSSFFLYEPKTNP